MKRFLYVFILMVSYVSSVMAQGSLRGAVYDEMSKEPLAYSTVVLMQSDKAVKTVVTDKKGSFKLTGIPYGKYKMLVGLVGYKKQSETITLSEKHKAIRIDSVLLAPTSLEEAVIVGQRTNVKLEVDRKLFDVDQQIAATGGSASDVLEIIPSVEVDQDGNVSLRGNSGVEIWINGKASGLNSDNRAEILQQIPAESIDRIEVIDNPSAKFSAEGSAGIINIILKKNRKAGYYGSLQVGGNTNGGANTSGNINYSSSKLETYLNIGYRHRQNKKGGSWSRQTFLQTDEYQNYDNSRHTRGNNLFARAGLTYHLTDKDDVTLGGSLMKGGHNNSDFALYHYGTNAVGTDSRRMTRVNTSDDDMNMYHFEFGYRHKFSDTHFLDFNGEYNRWMMDNENYYQDSTEYFMPSSPIGYSFQSRPTRIRNRSWEFKLDYENQITEIFRLQAGYNARLSHENTPQESFIDATSWTGTTLVEDKLYFNRFIYSQDVHAFYATGSLKFGNFGVMGGLRGEYWKVNTESYDYNQEHNPALRLPAFKKDFFELFPSLFLSYQISSTQQIQLNYTRRLRRPWGGQLNSFKNTRDASIVEYGNPELTPEFTNSFTLNYLKNWELHTLSVSAYYRPTTDVMQRIQYRNITDGMMYQTSKNLTKSTSTGLEVILKDKLFKCFDLTTTANFYYYSLDGFNYVIDGQTVTGESDHNFTWTLRMMGSLTLPADMVLQITGDYRSRQVVSQGYRKANYNIDLGLRKNFLHRTFAISLNCRDLLNSRSWETVTNSPQFTRHQKNWRMGRMLNLTFTWNFGNMKQKPQRNKRQQDDMNENMESGSGYGDMME